MRLIGITGGVGAGKTEILSFIKKHYSCRIYLADEVAHEIQKPGQPCYQEITALLGNDILKPDGSIDRGKLATHIFMNRNVLQQINAIVHPAVRIFLEDAVEEACKDGDVELFFIEAALLIENDYNTFVDEMWYVYASDPIRRERLKESRGYSDEKIDQIMKSQLSDDIFRNSSDFVIDNSNSLDRTFKQIKSRLGAYTWLE
ncbi:MAG TPA: dephospho-CoA kinase [Lachnospiraceae bacterium]|nr:dephospho-CoA kinase [Lachnospiraceae bacterium]